VLREEDDSPEKKAAMTLWFLAPNTIDPPPQKMGILILQALSEDTCKRRKDSSKYSCKEVMALAFVTAQLPGLIEKYRAGDRGECFVCTLKTGRPQTPRTPSYF